MIFVGLNDYVRTRVDRPAKLGYMAFAPDMYGKGVWTKDPKKAKILSGHLKGKPIMRQRAWKYMQVFSRKYFQIEHD